MKLISSLAIALVAADEKKVPPRHPLNRLNTLRTFITNFADDVIMPAIDNRKYADRFVRQMHGMMDNMENAYNRPNCGYYDPNSKHGGPDPNPDVKPNGKPRARRDAEEDTHFDDQQSFEDECAKGWENNNAVVRGECCDGVASYAAANADECASLPAVRRKGNKKTPWDRLSQDPALKWKQIMTGTRKWADRYINNCSGQRKKQHVSKRTKKKFAAVNNKLGF